MKPQKEKPVPFHHLMKYVEDSEAAIVAKGKAKGCSSCGGKLTPLEQPRKYAGKCLACVSAQ